MDAVILETYNGGDLNRNGNDVAIALGFENMPYIAMFGGNPKQSTPTKRVLGEQNFDWFGNVFETDAVVQTNSSTERVLRSVALNSAGRVLIEQAVNNDLAFMKAFSTVNVVVSIISDDRVQIDISIIEPTNLQNTSYRFIWDSSRQQINGGGNYVPPEPEPVGSYLLLENGFYLLQENGFKIEL